MNKILNVTLYEKLQIKYILGKQSPLSRLHFSNAMTLMEEQFIIIKYRSSIIQISWETCF